MQPNIESNKSISHDVIDIHLPTSLPSTTDRQFQRIRKHLFILNTLILLIWAHVIATVLICVSVIILLFEFQWFLWRSNFNTYFDYAFVLGMIVATCMIIHSIRVHVFKLGFEIKRFIDINEKAINQEV
ncbi:hypothetical protein I4U23_004229 [Adineta vaga]|nr:hypothetical protein I4U23_004229 [Adineta vaga]